MGGLAGPQGEAARAGGPGFLLLARALVSMPRVGVAAPIAGSNPGPTVGPAAEVSQARDTAHAGSAAG